MGANFQFKEKMIWISWNFFQIPENDRISRRPNSKFMNRTQEITEMLCIIEWRNQYIYGDLVSTQFPYFPPI